MSMTPVWNLLFPSASKPRGHDFPSLDLKFRKNPYMHWVPVSHCLKIYMGRRHLPSRKKSNIWACRGGGWRDQGCQQMDRKGPTRQQQATMSTFFVFRRKAQHRLLVVATRRRDLAHPWANSLVNLILLKGFIIMGSENWWRKYLLDEEDWLVSHSMPYESMRMWVWGYEKVRMWVQYVRNAREL